MGGTPGIKPTAAPSTERLGADDSLAKLVKSYFDRSIAEGLGEKALAAMFETMIKRDHLA
ncbi:MAG TPA: hypothetical protein VKN76_17055 [Kiloniellaceae bacterium]|nr:hypothetical protein [Kiloniellaceae bacterium]